MFVKPVSVFLPRRLTIFRFKGPADVRQSESNKESHIVKTLFIRVLNLL